MTTSNILKTFGVISLSTFLLTGCAGQMSSIPTPDTTQDIDVNIMESTTPESVEPTLSNSTEIDVLQKELNETTIEEPDFSDL